MDWNDYLKIANEVYSKRNSLASEEACCRSAISRAYYAVFNIADIRQRNKEKGLKPFSFGTHQNLIRYYKDHQDKKRKNIGTKLDRLSDLRNFCDYDSYAGKINIRDYPTQAANALTDTEELIALIAALKPR